MILRRQNVQYLAVAFFFALATRSTMAYWADPTAFEAHVRRQCESSAIVGCSLDVSAATAQQFSGFSSFSDAEGTTGDLL